MIIEWLATAAFLAASLIVLLIAFGAISFTILYLAERGK